MEQKYAVAGVEPPLEELLNDPITSPVMQRDGIGLAYVRRAVAAGRSRLRVSVEDAAQELRGLEPALELPPASGRGAAPGERPGGDPPCHGSPDWRRHTAECQLSDAEYRCLGGSEPLG